MALAPPEAAASGSLSSSGTLGKSSKGECVKVVVRVRPLSSQEITDGREVIVRMDIKRHVAILLRPGGTDREAKDFTFDAVFDENMSQQQIFDDTAADILDSVMDGFNGTIFAYGQTGAGKSHTMTGPTDGPLDQQGLLPRSFNHIFNVIDHGSQDTKYLVRGSYLEIYNEEIRDLLAKNPKERCELKDHPQGGVYVKDLSAFVVKNTEEMNQILDAGLANRAIGATMMNATSSRSHSIFMITVEQCGLGIDGAGHIRVGKLNMVDLAGSERQSKTGATGERLKEATKINLSLSALGNVISALVDGKSSHIPYRDSRLTRLLQDSLGGNTKTVMVANIGPADYNYDETASTLRYAYRAKSIKNKPRINEDPKDAMIREYQEEILRLKAELEAAGGEVDEHGMPIYGRPRIEKQVEYVEKIVERTVEKEVIVEQGPSPDEVAAMEAQLRQQNEEARLKAEARRREVEAQRDLAESERLRLMAQIDEEEQISFKEEQHKVELQAKLQQMEMKMVQGKQVMEQAIQQEEELKRQQRRLRKQQEKEEELKRQEEQQRQENIELVERCASQEEQVSKLTSKLQKLWDKYQKGQQEMVDIQHFNQQEREDMLSMIRELRQTLKLKSLIMESFVPMKEIQNTQERAVWDPEEDEWRIAPVALDKENRPQRPGSVLGLPRPTSEFTRLNRAMGDANPRYMYDSILFTDLDLPERTTEDYEVHPELGDRVERALMLALSQEDDDKEVKEKDRPGTSQKKRPSSGRPGTATKGGGIAPPSAFPQARGLVSRE